MSKLGDHLVWLSVSLDRKGRSKAVQRFVKVTYLGIKSRLEARFSVPSLAFLLEIGITCGFCLSVNSYEISQHLV